MSAVFIRPALLALLRVCLCALFACLGGKRRSSWLGAVDTVQKVYLGEGRCAKRGTRLSFFSFSFVFTRENQARLLTHKVLFICCVFSPLPSLFSFPTSLFILPFFFPLYHFVALVRPTLHYPFVFLCSLLLLFFFPRFFFLLSLLSSSLPFSLSLSRLSVFNKPTDTDNKKKANPHLQRSASLSASYPARATLLTI